MSDDLDLPPDHADRTALRMEDITRRLRVSSKTLQRYRRQGLVCHYVVFPEGKRLGCFADALERFLSDHRDRVERATTFSRIDEDDEATIIDAARRLRQREDLTLNEVALRLARTHQRAHETLRGVLRRHDRRSDEPIFGEHGPLTDRDTRLIERAIRRGVPVAELAARFAKSKATIARARNRRRADLLIAQPIAWVSLPTFDLIDAESVILAAPAVVHDLNALFPTDDALSMIDAALASDTAPDEPLEHALVAGYNFLKRRARSTLEQLPRWPAATTIDRVETDLRWATRVKRRLCSHALPVAIRRIEQNLHRPLRSQPADRIVELLRRAVSVVSDVVEPLDPSQGQRYLRRVGYAMDRALSLPGALPAAHDAAARAAARHEAGSIPLPGIFDGVTPWEPLLEFRSDLAAIVDRLDPERARVLCARYGLGSCPPSTLAELAARLDGSVTSIRLTVLDAERALRAIVRESAGRQG